MHDSMLLNNLLVFLIFFIICVEQVILLIHLPLNLIAVGLRPLLQLKVFLLLEALLDSCLAEGFHKLSKFILLALDIGVAGIGDF